MIYVHRGHPRLNALSRAGEAHQRIGVPDPDTLLQLAPKMTEVDQWPKIGEHFVTCESRPLKARTDFAAAAQQNSQFNSPRVIQQGRSLAKAHNLLKTQGQHLLYVYKITAMYKVPT